MGGAAPRLAAWRVKDLRHRPAQAILLLLAIAAGAATLTLGLSLQGTTDNPYARTRAATNGPDVVATVFPGGSNARGPARPPSPARQVTPGGAQADTAALSRFEHAPGVVAYSGPFPVTWTLFQKGHTTAGAPRSKAGTRAPSRSISQSCCRAAGYDPAGSSSRQGSQARSDFTSATS